MTLHLIPLLSLSLLLKVSLLLLYLGFLYYLIFLLSWIFVIWDKSGLLSIISTDDLHLICSSSLFCNSYFISFDFSLLSSSSFSSVNILSFMFSFFSSLLSSYPSLFVSWEFSIWLFFENFLFDHFYVIDLILV